MAEPHSAPLPSLPSSLPALVPDSRVDGPLPPAAASLPDQPQPQTATQQPRRGSTNSTTSNSNSLQPTRVSGRARVPSQKATEAAHAPEPSSSKTKRKTQEHQQQQRSSSEEQETKPTGAKRGRPSTAHSQSSSSSSTHSAGAGRPKNGVRLSGANNQQQINNEQPPATGAQETKTRQGWSDAEDLRMLALVRVIPSLSWGEIAGRMATGPGGTGVSRPAKGCIKRWYTVLKDKFGGVMRFEPDGIEPAVDPNFDVEAIANTSSSAPAPNRRWTGSEDSDLLLAVRLHGTDWNLVSSAITSGLGLTLGPQEDRTARSCRERYEALIDHASGASLGQHPATIVRTPANIRSTTPPAHRTNAKNHKQHTAAPAPVAVKAPKVEEEDDELLEPLDAHERMQVDPSPQPPPVAAPNDVTPPTQTPAPPSRLSQPPQQPTANAPAMVGGVLPGAPGTVTVPMKIVGKKLKRNSQAYQKPTPQPTPAPQPQPPTPVAPQPQAVQTPAPAPAAAAIKADHAPPMGSPLAPRLPPLASALNGSTSTPNKVTLNTSTLPRASLGGASPSFAGDSSFGTPGSVASSAAVGGTPLSATNSANGTPASVNGSEQRVPVVRGRRTANLQALQGVLLTPTGKVRKVHECPEPNCTAAFRRSEHLKRHYKSVHIGRRPFPCDWQGCDKTFTRNDNKQQHMSMVHGVKLPTAAAQAGAPGGSSSTSPPPFPADGGVPAQDPGEDGTYSGRLLLRGPQEKESDGGPELLAAQERKRVRDREAALLLAAAAASGELQLEEERADAERMIGERPYAGAAGALESKLMAAVGGEEMDAEGDADGESYEELEPREGEVAQAQAQAGAVEVEGEPAMKKARIE